MKGKGLKTMASLIAKELGRTLTIGQVCFLWLRERLCGDEWQLMESSL